MAKTTSVYPIQQDIVVDVGSTPVEVVIEDKRHTVESTTQPNPVEIIMPDVTVYTVGIQGPPGPPTGLDTEIQKLEFIGKGKGSTKTTTIIVGDTTIAEAFDVGDELYIQWVLPMGVNRLIAPSLQGSFFPTGSEVGTTVSWQVDFLADVHGGDVGGTTTVKELVDVALPETANTALHGELEFPNSGFLTDTTDAVHMRIKRIASSNDSSASVAIEHLDVHFATEGKVGIAGEVGPEGPTGGIGTVIFEYTATAGQTIITGVDNSGNTLSYTPGDISVRINGVALAEEDYVETDTGTITLVEALFLDDTIEVIAYSQGTGGGGGTASFEYVATAGENIGAYKVVRIALESVYIADKNHVSYIQDTLGLTTAVSTTGNQVTVRTGGELTNVSWTWTAGSVFLDTAGNLTQTPPTTGFLLKIGTVLTATSILIDIDDPILRA